jgi:two-component system sensor histidine kinase ChvG
VPLSAAAPRFRQSWVSPLLRRILLVNALPLALLVVALLYLDQYQNGLLEAQVGALREQARVFAGAMGESAVRTIDPDNPKLVPEIAQPLLRRQSSMVPTARLLLTRACGSGRVAPSAPNRFPPRHSADRC